MSIIRRDIIENQLELSRFILSSNIRLNIMYILYDHTQSLDVISQKMNKTPSNTLRTLNELIEKNLIIKFEKRYHLSSLGYLIVLNINHFLDNWNSVRNNADFWNRHDLDDVWEEFLYRVDIWEKSALVKNSIEKFDNTLNVFCENISKSKEMRIILPVYSKTFLNQILDSLVKNDVRLNIITNDLILNLISKNDDGLFEKCLNEGKIDILITENPLKIFFIACDNFSELFLFLPENHFDDTEMLVVHDDSSINNAINLFNLIHDNLDDLSSV